MTFHELSVYFDRIENTPSRNAMTQLLAELFSTVSADEINMVLYLLQGRVVPLYEKADFGMAEKLLAKAFIQALQIDKKVFDTEYSKIGDLGKTVEKLRNTVQTLTEITTAKSNLSISQVFEKLTLITQAAGNGSQDVKLGIIIDLIQSLDSLSCRYIARIPTNTLRLGFSDMTILDAFSWMLTGDKSLRTQIEKVYHVNPDLGFIGKTLKEKGVAGLSTVGPTLFTPILMMKAERLSSPEAIMEKVPVGIIEPKYDGFRLQIHHNKKDTRLYSRGLDDVTHMYPDVVAGVQKEIKADSIIFEGEAIGYDIGGGGFLPFQETVQRKRKYGIEEKALEIPLRLFAFDILFLDGKSLINEPLSTRRALLDKTVQVEHDIVKDTLLLSPDKPIEDPHQIELEFDDAISRGLEGIMVKRADGPYQPGARGWNWIKFKRSYSNKIDDTVDCVVMGYDYGKGKRAGFGLGAILIGIYDEKEDKYKTVSKLGTGLTDDEWRLMFTKSEKIKSATKPALYDVDDLMKPDVYVKPEIVLEIKADELTRSPSHTAGRVMEGNKVKTPGYALRFPRLERIREDKRPEDVTALVEIEEMFSGQKK